MQIKAVKTLLLSIGILVSVFLISCNQLDSSLDLEFHEKDVGYSDYQTYDDESVISTEKDAGDKGGLDHNNTTADKSIVPDESIKPDENITPDENPMPDENSMADENITPDENTIPDEQNEQEVTDEDHPHDSAYAYVTAPQNGAVFKTGDSVTITTDVYDPDGIDIVRFWLDNGTNAEVIFADRDTPYEYNWTPATAGTYKIWIKFKDLHGNAITSEKIEITVKASDNNTPDENDSNFQVKLNGSWKAICCLNGNLEVSSGQTCDWVESERVLTDTNANKKLDCPEGGPITCSCANTGERMHGAPDGPVNTSLMLDQGAPIFPNIGRETCVYVDNGILKTRWSSVQGDKWNSSTQTWPDPDCPHFRLIDFY